jgi:hypothetical protein
VTSQVPLDGGLRPHSASASRVCRPQKYNQAKAVASEYSRCSRSTNGFCGSAMDFAVINALGAPPSGLSRQRRSYFQTALREFIANQMPIPARAPLRAATTTWFLSRKSHAARKKKRGRITATPCLSGAPAGTEPTTPWFVAFCTHQGVLLINDLRLIAPLSLQSNVH